MALYCFAAEFGADVAVVAAVAILSLIVFPPQFFRWFYNESSGLCEPFSFSGCRGNANRFLRQADCSNACAHEARRRRTDVVCGLPIVDGATEECPGENETSSVVAR